MTTPIQDESGPISVRIWEQEGLDSNFATKQVSSGKTGRIQVLLRKGGANYSDVMDQGVDVAELQAILETGVRKIGEMLKQGRPHVRTG